MRKGFTLIEVVVAIGIFSIASVVISSVYLNANSLQQHTTSLQRLQNEGRYIIEKISKEIRAREIDYSAVDESSQPQNYINFLKDEVGEKMAISLSADGKNLEYSINGSVANLNAQDVEIIDLKFYVIPNRQDKWGIDPITNFQPRVTILLKLRSNPPNPKFQQDVILQTTISSKVYKR